MRFLPLSTIVVAIFLVCSPARAQEAVSSGSGGGSSSSGSSSSGGSSGDTSSTSSSGSSSTTTTSTSAPPVTGGSQATGTGLYAKLPFELSFSLNQGYDDNASNTSGSKQGSAFTSGNIDLAYDFGDPRLQMSLSAGAGGTYYYQNIAIQDYDINLHGALNVDYKANPRLDLKSKLYLAYLTEPTVNFGYGVNRRSGNYFVTQDQFTGTYEWLPRFATATSYTIAALNYDERSIGEFEDRVENTLGNEFRFLLQPTTTLVGEYRYQIITYSYINRDSTTHYLLGGLDHTFTPRFTGSVRGGVEIRDYDQGDNRTEPYVEGSLNYNSSKRSSITWNIHYGLEEPDFAEVPSRKTFRTGLQVNQELMPRLKAQLAFYYQHDENEGLSSTSLMIPSFSEDWYDISISGRYMVTHYLGIQAGYDHTEVGSGIPSREYSRNRVYGGVNIAF